MRIVQRGKEEVEGYGLSLWKEFGEESGMPDKEEILYFSIEDEKRGKRLGFMKVKIRLGIASLDELILEKGSRNRGIGAKALSFFEGIAEKEACHKLRVKTCPELMPAAYYLYKKHGYREEAWLRNDYFNKDWVILSKVRDNA